MRILISGGEKSENVKAGVSRSFNSSADELMVEKFIDAIPSIYTRGDFFDKALITEQSITKEHTIKDETEIRQRINKFAIQASKRPHKASYVFLAQREDIAMMIYEETRALANNSVVILKGPPYKATFFTTILSKDSSQFDKEWIYVPEDIGIEETEETQDETKVEAPEIDLNDNFNVISAPDDGFGDKLFGDDDYDFSEDTDTSDEGFVEDEGTDSEFNGDDFDDDFDTDDFSGDDFDSGDFDNGDFDASDFGDEDFGAEDFTEDAPDNTEDAPDNTENKNEETEDVSDTPDFPDDFDDDFGDVEPDTDPYKNMVADNMDGVSDTPEFDDDEYDEEIKSEQEEENNTKESEESTMNMGNNRRGNNPNSNQSSNQFNENLINEEDDFLPGFDDEEYGDDDFNEFDNGSYEDDNTPQQTPGFSDDDYDDDDVPVQPTGRKPVPMASQQIDDDMYDEPQTQEVGGFNSLTGAEAGGIAAGAGAADEAGLVGKGKSLLGKLGKGKTKNIKKAQEVANIPQPMVNTGNGAMIQNNQNGGLEAEASRKVRASAGKVKDGLKPFAARGNNIVCTGFGGCGTSTVAYGLANILVQLGYNVLLVDCDTRGRAQNYISRTSYDAMSPDGANLMAAINSSTGLNKQMSVVKQGFHLLTMGMGSDIQPIQEMIHKEKIARFMTNAKSTHNFVIYDIPFDIATDFLSDITFGADNLVTVVDSSTWGITKMLLGICNIANEDMQDTFFNRAQLVFNKERHLTKVLGHGISSTDDILSVVDNQVFELLGDDPGYYFKTMKVAGIIKDDPAVEKGWFENTHYSDTAKGQEVFLNLVNNIILRRK